MGVKVDSIDIDKSVEAARKLLEEEQVSPACEGSLFQPDGQTGPPKAWPPADPIQFPYFL